MYAVPGAVTTLPSRVSYVTSGAEIPGGMAAPAGVAYPQAPQIYAPSMVSPGMQTQTRVVTLSVSEAEVLVAQKAWSDAIKHISKTYLDGGDYVAAAAKAAGELYGYGHSDVLFKPTKAAEAQFRPTASDAMSYFVGHKAVENGYLEDAGFAINGGKGWSNVVFDNHKIHVSGNVAIAMGNTSSPALQMEARPRLSTLSATRRMRTARCASSSTTPQCHTACLQPLHLERLLKRK